jgi:hypothetical protein
VATPQRGNYWPLMVEGPDFGEQFEASDNFRTSFLLIEINNLQVRPYPNA